MAYRVKRQPVVGYRSKSGNLRAYRQVAKTKDGRRVLLRSFGPEPIEFWVDVSVICEAPPNPRKCDECDGWDGHHYPDCCFL